MNENFLTYYKGTFLCYIITIKDIDIHASDSLCIFDNPLHSHVSAETDGTIHHLIVYGWMSF